MAEGAPVLQADPVAGLIDIPLPPPVSLWPQTWTSRIAIALALAGLIAAIFWFIRWSRANRYRREALAELDGIEHALDAGRPAAQTASALALLVRRTALAAFPRERVVALAGADWLAFLDRSYGGHGFSQGPGRILSIAPYRPQPVAADQMESLIELVRRWIRMHHD